jgi:hypothetical protein
MARDLDKPADDRSMSNRKLAINLAGCTGAVLVVMVILSFATGATQEAHEHYDLPEAYAISLLEHANALRVVFALDIAFLALYTGFFAAFARYLGERGRPFVKLALGLMVATALLDVLEDHHITTMLDAAERGVLPTNSAIADQVLLSSTKFSVSYVSLFFFGLAVPRDTKLGLVLSLFLTGGTLLSAVIGYSLPPESAHSFDNGRWVGFLIGFVLAIAWLLKAPEPKEA